MSRRVLLTGATGFVGRQILRELLRQHADVTVVVRSDKNICENIPPNNQPIKIILTKDLFKEKSDWWKHLCQDIDIVIHAAWYAEPGKYLESPINVDCLLGTLELAKGAVEANICKFVGIGTCFEYDLSEGFLSIDTPLKPLTPYAGAKVAVYSMLSEWLPRESVGFLWCRLFYLFGEGEDPRRFIPFLRNKLAAGEPVPLTSGNQIRDYLDVAEAGKRIAQAALGSETGVINVCSGIPIAVREMAEKVADEYGRRDLLIFGAREPNAFDPERVVGVK